MNARLQDKRLWLGGGALIAVLIVLLGWFFVIDPELSAASSTWDDADTARSQNIVLEAKNARLKTQNDDVAALRAGLADALAALPFDSGLPAFTRQVSRQATDSSLVLSSVVVGGAVAVPAAGGAAAATTAAASADTAGTPAAAAASTGLVAISITLVATGLGSNQRAFMTAIQVDGPRRALVTDIQMAPLGENAAGGILGETTLTLQLTVFSNPLSPDAQAALEKLLSGE